LLPKQHSQVMQKQYVNLHNKSSASNFIVLTQGVPRKSTLRGKFGQGRHSAFFDIETERENSCESRGEKHYKVDFPLVRRKTLTSSSISTSLGAHRTKFNWATSFSARFHALWPLPACSELSLCPRGISKAHTQQHTLLSRRVCESTTLKKKNTDERDRLRRDLLLGSFLRRGRRFAFPALTNKCLGLIAAAAHLHTSLF
jgi:hypothetical protein